MIFVHVEDRFDPEAGYQINELLKASKGHYKKTYLITSDDMSVFHKEVNPHADLKFEAENNVKIIRLKKKLQISSRIVLKNLDKTIRTINPDIVFYHGIGDFKDIMLFSKRKKYIVFRDCHMSWSGSYNKFRDIYLFIYSKVFAKIINNTKKYDKIFSLGEEETEYLLRMGIKRNKIELLPHGYNKNTMYYSEIERNNIRKKFDIKNNEILISYIGKFDNYKRPDLIIDIFEEMDKDLLKKFKIKLLFLGSKQNDYMQLFNKKINESYIKKISIIHDSVKYEELYKYFSASDICIFPKETTLSSIHAQICNSIVIMENHKSNRERVINNNDLFPIDNLEEASRILRNNIINFNENVNNIKRSKNRLVVREYNNQIKIINDVIKETSRRNV